MTDIHESVGCYAVSALDRSELIEFEAHLATCAACRNEAAELCETAADLTLLSLAAPPPTLRASILAAILRTPLLRALDGAVRSTPPVSRSVAESRLAAASSGPRRAAPESDVPEPGEEPRSRGDEASSWP